MVDILSQVGQEIASFGAVDLLTIATLTALEGILSVDNALVLAILVRELPGEQRRRALTYGIVGAFVFRFIALLFAGQLMKLMVFKLIGGGYLVYLAMKHMFFFAPEDAHGSGPATARSFWKTVVVVELTDIAFSIDSITTAVAMSNKLVVVWIGGILGIIALRFAAGAFVQLLEKLPRLEDLAYQLIFFIGTKLALDAFGIHIGHATFWMMMAIIAVIGAALVYRDHHQRVTHTRFRDRLLEQVEQGEVSVEELMAQEQIPGEVLRTLQRRGLLKIPDPAAPAA